MKVLTYGDIMQGGSSVFTATARLEDDWLVVSFSGAIRVDNPHVQLQAFIDAIQLELKDKAVGAVTLEFTDLKFCNSNGFYVIMDVIESVYENSDGPVHVRRLEHDDWQQQTLPILLDLGSEEVRERTSFEDVRNV